MMETTPFCFILRCLLVILVPLGDMKNGKMKPNFLHLWLHKSIEGKRNEKFLFILLFFICCYCYCCFYLAGQNSEKEHKETFSSPSPPTKIPLLRFYFPSRHPLDQKRVFAFHILSFYHLERKKKIFSCIPFKNRKIHPYATSNSWYWNDPEKVKPLPVLGPGRKGAAPWC